MKIVLWAVYLLSLYFGVFWFLVFLDRQDRKTPPNKYEPFVSVVVPAYNEQDTLKITLDSVANLSYPKDKYEVIVVDDGSSDNTPDVAKNLIAMHKDTSIIYVYQVNGGKGSALNTGLARAKGEVFVCLDADSAIEIDALQKMLPHFDKQDVAAVLPVVKVREPKNLWQKMQWYEYNINTFYKELGSLLDCVHVAPGPFSAYKAEILRKVGGFDSKRNLTEDLEMALRLQSKQYKLVQLLNTDVATVAPDNFIELYKQRNRWYKGAIINAIKYRHMIFNKKYGDFGFIQMPTIILSGVIAVVLILSMAWYALTPYIETIWDLQFIQWDWWTLLSSYSFNLNWLDIDFMAMLFAGFMLSITLYIVKKSHAYTREKARHFGALPLFVYLFFYFVILATMWIGIGADLLLRRNQKW